MGEKVEVQETRPGLSQNALRIFTVHFLNKFRTPYLPQKNDSDNLALALERVDYDLELFEERAKEFVNDFDPYWEPYDLAKLARFVK